MFSIVFCAVIEELCFLKLIKGNDYHMKNEAKGELSKEFLTVDGTGGGHEAQNTASQSWWSIKENLR